MANPLGGVVKMHQKPIVRGLRGTRDEQHHNEPHAPLRRLSTAGGVILDAPRAREKLLAGGQVIRMMVRASSRAHHGPLRCLTT